MPIICKDKVIFMNHVHLENRRISRQFLAIIWIEYALIYMTKNCFSAAMASIVYEGVLTKSQTGLINAVFYIFYGPLQIVGGVIADRHNPENLIKIGLFSSSVINLALFFVHDYISMLVLWGLNGIAQFAIWPSIVKIITSQLTPEDGKSGAFYITFASIGGLLVSYLTAALVTQWEYNFLISGLVLLVLALMWMAECHNVDHYMVLDDVPVAAPKEEQQVPSEKLHPRPFLASGFVFIVIYFFFRTMVDQGVKAFSPTMLMELYPGVTPSVGNLLNILIIGVTLLGAVLIRKFYPKIIHSEVTGMFTTAALALPFCGILLFARQIHIALSVACLCAVACVMNCGTVLVNCSNVHFAKYGKSATAAGIVNAVASVGFIVVNYGIALLADLLGWETVLICFFSCVIVATAVIAVVIPKWRKFIGDR